MPSPEDVQKTTWQIQKNFSRTASMIGFIIGLLRFGLMGYTIFLQ